MLVFGVFPRVENGLKYWERLAYWDQSRIFKVILIIQNGSALNVRDEERCLWMLGVVLDVENHLKLGRHTLNIRGSPGSSEQS